MSITREIIDIHTHVWPDKIAIRAADNIVNYYSLSRQGDGSVEGIFRGAEEFENIRFVISSATLKPDIAHAQVGNDFLINTASNDPRFIPLASFHPLIDFDETVRELERCKALGAKGIKIHSDFQRFFVDDANAIEIYKEAARLKLPILFHAGDKNTDFSTPKRIRNILEKLPELTIIAAHMCGYSVWDEAKEYLIGTPVYTDTSEARLGMDANSLYNLIDQHGVERVMFGSDYPLWRTDFAFHELEECALTDAEKDLIYCENAKKVFDL
ncbi:MAG: amidohydrolase family protein [Clostridia bacterium]|nr:amidohydrolase family protein [Clostridia bacterium]